MAEPRASIEATEVLKNLDRGLTALIRPPAGARAPVAIADDEERTLPMDEQREIVHLAVGVDESASDTSALADRRLALLVHAQQMAADNPDAEHQVWVQRPGIGLECLSPPSHHAVRHPRWAPQAVTDDATQRNALPAGRTLAWIEDGEDPTGQAQRIRWATIADAEPLPKAAMTSGASFAFSPSGRSLLVADLAAGQIVRRALATNAIEPLAPIVDDGALAFPPVIAVSPDGAKIAFSCHQGADAETSVWLLERRAGATSCELVTSIPGRRVYATPFWSPGGRTLGLSITHVSLQRSAMVLWRHCRGEGVVVREAWTLDAPVMPQWDDRFGIIFYRGTEPCAVANEELDEAGAPRLPPQSLSVLDPTTRAVSDILSPAPRATRLACESTAIVMDGTAEPVRIEWPMPRVDRHPGAPSLMSSASTAWTTSSPSYSHAR